MGMIKHSQITQSNKFSISLQYLKKEVRNRGNFWHADKCHSFHKLVLSFLMEVARHVQNKPKQEVGNLNVLLRVYSLIIKRITRSAIIVEINIKDVKLVKTNISSLHSKRHLQSISLFT